MKVLVTGASGNVGTSVLRALAADPGVTEMPRRRSTRTSAGPLRLREPATGVGAKDR